jgi:hypothetical protein
VQNARQIAPFMQEVYGKDMPRWASFFDWRQSKTLALVVQSYKAFFPLQSIKGEGNAHSDEEGSWW